MRVILTNTNSDGNVITYYASEDGKVITSEITYARTFKGLQEELEEENEKLPKTKRRYMTDEGKIVGYLTAKKLGIIS